MEYLLAAVSAVFGSMVGSFLNVVIYRVPEKAFFERGTRSRCRSCGARIAGWDNVPVLSWLLLRGKARCCGARISVQYPLVEAGTALAFLAVWLHQGSGRVWTAGEGWVPAAVGELLASWFLVAVLIAHSVIDLRHRILPDALNFIGLVVGVVLSAVLPRIHAGSWPYDALAGAGPASAGLLTGLAGAAVGAGLLWLVAWGGERLYRTEAMGLGDVKLMAFLGAFIGPVGVLLAIGVAVLLGAVVGIVAVAVTRDPKIPFGPFLAIGSLASWFAEPGLRTLLVEDWPRWLQQSAAGPFVLVGICLVCLGAILFLRRLRR
ncbi:MAG: prepilin peptidase [Planctomycetota bacterium]